MRAVGDGVVVVLDGPEAGDSAGPCPFVETGEFLDARPVGRFRLLFGVQVVEVAVALVEAVRGGQEFVLSPRWFLPNWPVT